MPRGGTAIATDYDLQHYLRQINEVRLLTAEEERDLARQIAEAGRAAERFARRELSMAERQRAEERGRAARERMIRANLRLVVTIAKGYAKRGVPLADLVEEGNLGLLRAVEGFDPNQGTRFCTYASWWIKQAIKRAMINAVQPVHIPAYMVEMIARWREAQVALRDRFGRPPTVQELAEQMQMPERKVRIIKGAVRALSSGNQRLSSDSGAALSEMLPDDRTPAPDEALFDERESDLIQRMLDQITEREATILRLRYGLEDNEPLTHKEIGRRVRLTRERVRQIELEALAKLSALINGEPLPDVPGAVLRARRPRTGRARPAPHASE
jgi:RNA polymerase primary sigma factor